MTEENILHSCEINRLASERDYWKKLADDRLAEWDRLRTVFDELKKEHAGLKKDYQDYVNNVRTVEEIAIGQLEHELEAAINLIQVPGRITWGYNLKENTMMFYLDGRSAGKTIRDVVRMEARILDNQKETT